MKEMQAILHVKKILCNLLHAFSGFKLLVFPFGIRRDEQWRKKAFFGAVHKIQHKAVRQQQMARGLKFKI